MQAVRVSRFALTAVLAAVSVGWTAYVPNVVKVQIWCAFAETVLGETTSNLR